MTLMLGVRPCRFGRSFALAGIAGEEGGHGRVGAELVHGPRVGFGGGAGEGVGPGVAGSGLIDR
jgi:hypothetical protein